MFATPVTQADNKITTVPAPIGGLNARDSLAAMPETDAVVMVNYWPQPYGVSVRKGYQYWATGLGGEVSTLAQWAGVSGELKLFAWAVHEVYDVSSRGPVGLPAITGLTNAFWQTTTVVNAAGSHLLAVNGADDGIAYDSTGINRIIAGDGVAAWTWSGLDPKTAIQLTDHQHRLWVVKKDSAIGYYLPPDAVYGVFESFDFGPLFSRGGYISFMTTWTIDDGNGAEDHLVVASSRGEVAVYAGTDPSNATTWALVGVYYVGAPVKGRRSYSKVGGDLYLLTQQGIASMAELLTSTKVNEATSAFKSNKIQFLMSELIGTYGDLANWQLSYVPKINMLICNVPSVVLGGNTQIVANQIIGAWAQFSGMDAACWTTYDAQPFFGDYEGRVHVAWYGGLDRVDLAGLGGTAVLAEVQQAYSYLNSLGTQKQVGMYRPNFIVATPVAYKSGIEYDFQGSSVPAPDSVAPSLGSLWDDSKWGTAQWYGGTSNQRIWSQASGMGVAASVHLKTVSTNDVLWISTDYSYKVGTLL